MKRIILTTLFLLATIMLPASADDGLYYSYDEGKSEATVIAGEVQYSGNIIIPEATVHDGKTYIVTAIGESAFFSCNGLTGVSIPNTVTDIGSYAFCRCYNLAVVNLGCSVTSIGASAFSSCDALTSIIIPQSVMSIGYSAFVCRGLKSIVVLNGNTVYDSRDNCNAIIETATNTLIAGCQNTIIPGTVTTIGRVAFSSCVGLTHIDIPESVTTMERFAFMGSGLAGHLIIPNTVTTIDENVFEECHHLKSVYIGSGLANIGRENFYGCDSLESIVVDADNPHFDSRENCNAIISKNNSLRSGCKNTIIPNTVTNIGASAFAGCRNLESVIIPNSVTEIINRAFYASGVTDITIGKGVTKIYPEAFLYCWRLTKIVCLPTTPPTIYGNGYDSFSSDVMSQATVYVPAASLETYRTTRYWSDFASFKALGDVNGDDQMNITDVTMMITDLLNSNNDIAADYNADGEVNISDIIAMIAMLLGEN